MRYSLYFESRRKRLQTNRSKQKKQPVSCLLLVSVTRLVANHQPRNASPATSNTCAVCDATDWSIEKAKAKERDGVQPVKPEMESLLPF